MSKDYPKWIDEYAVAMQNAFSHMIPGNWGPLDFFVIKAVINGQLIAKVHEAVQKIKNLGYSPEQVKSLFSNPSTLKCTLFFMMIEYQNSNPKNKDQFRDVMDFFVQVLQSWTPDDLWTEKSNRMYKPAEISSLIDGAHLLPANPQIARELGKLNNSLYAFVFAHYRDFFPQDAWEVSGPYDVSEKFGAGATMVIKDFSKLKPTDLWPIATNYKYSNLRIFQVYQDVEFSCEMIGMHSMFKGDVINGLRYYSVFADGENYSKPDQIKNLIDHFAIIATEQIKIYANMSKAEFVKKFLEWDGYQFNKFFESAGMDWRPSEEMIVAAVNAEIPERLIMDSFPDLEEFSSSPDFEVYWLKDLYSENKKAA